MSLVYVFTGEGKGKTSAALGMTLRARAAGLKVAWIAWYKDPSWNVSEYKMNELLGVDLFIGGKGFYFKDKSKIKATKVGAVVDKAEALEHESAAQISLNKLEALIDAGEHDLIVCDELCQAVGEGLVEKTQVEKLVAGRGKIHLVLTGRNCPDWLSEAADTVTNMTNIKHAYDRGIAAVKGLDF